MLSTKNPFEPSTLLWQIENFEKNKYIATYKKCHEKYDTKKKASTRMSYIKRQELIINSDIGRSYKTIKSLENDMNNMEFGEKEQNLLFQLRHIMHNENEKNERFSEVFVEYMGHIVNHMNKVSKLKELCDEYVCINHSMEKLIEKDMKRQEKERRERHDAACKRRFDRQTKERKRKEKYNEKRKKSPSWSESSSDESWSESSSDESDSDFGKVYKAAMKRSKTDTNPTPNNVPTPSIKTIEYYLNIDTTDKYWHRCIFIPFSNKKVQYYALCKAFHPDRNRDPRSTQVFQLIQVAYRR